MKTLKRRQSISNQSRSWGDATPETGHLTGRRRFANPFCLTLAVCALVVVASADNSTERTNAPPVTNYNAFFHFGAFILNPYRIDRDTRELDAGDLKAKAFLEFVYNNRWAWDSDRFGKSPIGSGLGFTNIGCDFQGRLSYTFDGGDSPSASTIVGSGDVAAEFTLGSHLWRQRFEKHAQSVNFEFSYGAVSDRNVFDVHHRFFLGLGYVGSIPEPVLGNGRNVLFSLRAGGANIEHVSFVSTTTNLVKFRNTVPDYGSSWGAAIETEVLYPILEQSFFTAGGRLYGGSDPNVWSMWIGFTTPLARIGSLIPK